ncbi:MAG TPA: histidine kinase dimerization/phosphoacceptor domain -containing protein [Rectinemataceae bacterium]|nr:histidine kinase dimerization/phosphoacceptor domain -containing protein [Rectinemataceae bacterium]
MERTSGLRVIYAIEDEDERVAFAALAEALKPPFVVHYPADIAEVERLYSADAADVIVTDFGFHNGTLADWLTLWPLPSVVVIGREDDPARVERTIKDESSVFIERRPEGQHVRLIPALIRKVVNIRESLRRQNAHLQMTEHQYLNLLQAVPDIVYILDGDGRFIYLNDAIRNLGYDPAKLIGRHFSEIIHPADVPKVSKIEVLDGLKGSVTGQEGSPKLFDERRSGRRMTRNLELRLMPGAESADFRYASVNAYGEVNCSGYHLPEYEGQGLGTVGVIRDVSDRKNHQRELEAALTAREVLLKEIHHRVKNNLQIVSSLLNLQEASVTDEASRKVFLECQSQIQSMAMVHEVLYRAGDFKGVDMQKYFERLLEYLAGVYDSSFNGISCEVEARETTLGLDAAIAVALIVNELVSNCFKHAFPDGRAGRVSLTMSPQDGDWILRVADDGVGFEATRSEDSKGIGTELVEALAAQLRGSVEHGASRGPQGGALVSVRFPREGRPDLPA